MSTRKKRFWAVSLFHVASLVLFFGLVGAYGLETPKQPETGKTQEEKEKRVTKLEPPQIPCACDDRIGPKKFALDNEFLVKVDDRLLEIYLKKYPKKIEEKDIEKNAEKKSIPFLSTKDAIKKLRDLRRDLETDNRKKQTAKAVLPAEYRNILLDDRINALERVVEVVLKKIQEKKETSTFNPKAVVKMPVLGQFLVKVDLQGFKKKDLKVDKGKEVKTLLESILDEIIGEEKLGKKDLRDWFKIQRNYNLQPASHNGPSPPAPNDRYWSEGHLNSNLALSWAPDKVGMKSIWENNEIWGNFWTQPVERPAYLMVIDSGIMTDHPDLASNIDIHGINSWGLYPPEERSVCEYEQTVGDISPEGITHGTKVAGVAVGVANNDQIGEIDKKIIGVAPRFVKLISGKVWCRGKNTPREGTLAHVNKAIEYAIDKVHVVNMSFTFKQDAVDPEDLEVLKQLMRDTQATILYVAAAGYGGDDIALKPVYPASLDLDTDSETEGFPNLIAVAATDENDAVPSYENFSPTRVSLGAPGVSIATTGFAADPEITWGDGSSAATPVVAACAALIQAALLKEGKDPLLPGELKTILKKTGDPSVNPQGRVIGKKRLNCNKAFKEVFPSS